jgi:hypothetical protein
MKMCCQQQHLAVALCNDGSQQQPAPDMLLLHDAEKESQGKEEKTQACRGQMMEKCACGMAAICILLVLQQIVHYKCSTFHTLFACMLSIVDLNSNQYDYVHHMFCCAQGVCRELCISSSLWLFMFLH